MLTILWHVFCNELNATKTQLRNGFSTTQTKRKARSRHKKCWGKRSSEACLLLKEALLSKHTECTNRQGGPGFFFFPWYSDTLVAKALAVQGITWLLWIIIWHCIPSFFFCPLIPEMFVHPCIFTDGRRPLDLQRTHICMVPTLTWQWASFCALHCPYPASTGFHVLHLPGRWEGYQDQPVSDNLENNYISLF